MFGKACLIASGLLLLAGPVVAQEQGELAKEGNGWSERIDREVETSKGGTLVLTADKGQIEVATWGKEAVRVEVEKWAEVFTEEEARRVFADFEVRISQENGQVRVLAEPRSDRRLQTLEVDFKITVPEQYSVDLTTAGGGIEMGNLEGNVKARTAGGGIDVGNIRNGSVDVSTAGGGIEIGGIENGDGRAVTSGGSIEVGNVTGDLMAKTVGGGITVGRVGGELEAKTAGGGIEIAEGGEAVLANTSGGGIRVGKASGDVEVKTMGGGIEIGPAGGDIRAKTMGGGIEIGESRGSVQAETMGGGISVDGSGGPVKVETMGGSIEVKKADGYIEAKTTGGSISAELAIADSEVDTHCTLETSGGDVTIYLPAGLQATIDAEVRIEGRVRRDYEIRADFPLEIEGAERGSRRLTAQGTLNGGGDLIKLRTTNGDIAIKKR